jgi:hypothetical protein
MLAFRSVQQSNHCAREDFLYEPKAGPGRPEAARRAGNDTTVRGTSAVTSAPRWGTPGAMLQRIAVNLGQQRTLGLSVHLRERR